MKLFVDNECNKSLEHWYNESDWTEPQHLKKNLFQCYSIHHQSDTDWPKTKLRPVKQQASNKEPEP